MSNALLGTSLIELSQKKNTRNSIKKDDRSIGTWQTPNNHSLPVSSTTEVLVEHFSTGISSFSGVFFSWSAHSHAFLFAPIQKVVVLTYVSHYSWI